MDPVVIPSMWREELYHPLLAHAPITLVPLALLLRAGMLALKGERWRFLEPSSRLILLLAVAMAWVAMRTGEIAEDVVNRVICDPTVTHEHEEFAEWTTYLVTALAAVDLAHWRFKFRPLIWGSVTVLGLIAATALIARTGHLGASLVYQQGAAVYHPTPECREFE